MACPNGSHYGAGYEDGTLHARGLTLACAWQMQLEGKDNQLAAAERADADKESKLLEMDSYMAKQNAVMMVFPSVLLACTTVDTPPHGPKYLAAVWY